MVLSVMFILFNSKQVVFLKR